MQQAYAGEQRLSYFDLAAFSQQSVLATFDDDLATFDDVTLLLQFQEVVFVFSEPCFPSSLEELLLA